MPRKAQDYTGQVFGDLIVISDAPSRKGGRYLNCLCICGASTEVHLSNLKKEVGGTKSCGCVGKHGGTHTRLHSIWQNMKQRCYNNKHTNYKHYGEIGVTVCDDWRNNFTAFRDWALSAGYQDELSIDRIAGALIYSPGTCRWANQETQNRNKRAHVNTSSKYIGVCFFARTQRWLAYISISGKRKYLGYHESEELAAIARDNYVLQHGLKDFVLNGVTNVRNSQHTNTGTPSI